MNEYKDIILKDVDFGGRFFTKAPNEIWDRKVMTEPMMKDSPFERQTCQIFLDKARGDVFIGGLGIGLVPMAIMNNPEVKSILIVEVHQEVIDLIKPQVQFNEKVEIVLGNAHTYVPEKNFDVFILDDWTAPDEGLIPDGATAEDMHLKFHDRMSNYLNLGGVILDWKMNDSQLQEYFAYVKQFEHYWDNPNEHGSE